MIIARTPTRVSLFGGGTDYPSWYRDNGGEVISATINKYSFITLRELPPFFDYRHRIRYYKHEETNSLNEIEHPSVRECAKYVGFEKGLEVVHNADLPARSGLGSSSTFTVGMLHALHAALGYMPTKRELAQQAIHVEQNIIGEAVGSQDQVAAAFGGLNYISFSSSKEFDVQPLTIGSDRVKSLQDRILLCFTGFARTASEIAIDQIARTSQNGDLLNQMRGLTASAFEVLRNPTNDIDDIGFLLNEQWGLKSKISNKVSTTAVDEIYSTGLRAGALGGKLLGAGGGGFMMFFAPPERHAGIRAALNEKMFVPFRFEFSGSSIVYSSHD